MWTAASKRRFHFPRHTYREHRPFPKAKQRPPLTVAPLTVPAPAPTNFTNPPSADTNRPPIPHQSSSHKSSAPAPPSPPVQTTPPNTTDTDSPPPPIHVERHSDAHNSIEPNTPSRKSTASPRNCAKPFASAFPPNDSASSLSSNATRRERRLNFPLHPVASAQQNDNDSKTPPTLPNPTPPHPKSLRAPAAKPHTAPPLENDVSSNTSQPSRNMFPPLKGDE
jgi:hypothetical protein